MTERIWGTGVYTDDSYICTAAIHNDKIKGIRFCITFVFRITSVSRGSHSTKQLNYEIINALSHKIMIIIYTTELFSTQIYR